MLTDLQATLHPAWLVARREIRDQFRDWRIIIPVVTLTIFFPYLMNFTAQQLLGFVRQYGAELIGDRLIPFLMMIVGFFPISVSLVIALESFVGERERGSIEPLLSTPLKDWQLYLGKLCAAVLPPVLSSYLGMAVYIGGLFFKGINLPPPGFILQVFCLTTVQAVVMVSGSVVVSTQATSIRAANLLASFIVIPVALLIQGESLVMFWGRTDTLWWIVAGLMVLSVLLVRVGLAHFRREELLGRDIDVLNFRWMIRVFWQTFRGDAKNLLEWYREVLPQAARQLIPPSLMVAVLVIAGFFLGSMQVDRFTIPLGQIGINDVRVGLFQTTTQWPLFSFRPVLGVWLQNLRVLFISLVLGIFSFGVLGMFPIILTMGVAGYLMQLLALNGISPWMYLGSFLLPHGIIEIPVAVLSVAAVLRMGALLAARDSEHTIGEVLLMGLADWAKITVGWVIPLMLLAAMVEIWLTPRVALWLAR